MSIRTALFVTTLFLACAPVSIAIAQDDGLAGPPAGMHAEGWTPDTWRSDEASRADDWRRDGWRRASWRRESWRRESWRRESWRRDGWRRDGWRDAAAGPAEGLPTHGRHGWEGRMAQAGKGGECWAQVKYAAQYAPPPTGPEYVWTRQPGPPGAPGPIWCLTVQPLPSHPVMVSPERYGWVRVLCGDQATPPRIARLQRGLHERGLYRGEIDGRYDDETAFAVRRFQQERHIEHRGYLSYETEAAIDEPPPPTLPRPQLTTFDTGYIDWPGKVRY